jgi:chromosome segregation ATPase
MQHDETREALEAARVELRRLHGKLQRTTARAILAEDRLRDLEAERDIYAQRWAQAEAARMALAGEGPFAEEEVRGG